MSTLAIDVIVRAMISILVLIGRSYRKKINGSDNNVVVKVDNIAYPGERYDFRSIISIALLVVRRDRKK